jgi:uncharacterized membrane protein YcaP (DUF421 family)
LFTIMIRTAILYFLVVLSLRLMGKRQIGQLQPFELVIAIMISELASLPMQDTRLPLINGVIAIVTLLILQIMVSLVQLKIESARLLLNGKPTILIKKGKILIDQLKRQTININDLMEELRIKGYYNLGDIEYAILETSGQLSVIPKTELTFASKKDMHIETDQDILPVTLILDGRINSNNLNLIQKDYKWLMIKLKEKSIYSADTVFFALMDSKGEFYCQLYNDYEE